MHRHVIGAVGLFVLLAGVAVWALVDREQSWWAASGALIRVGLLTLAIWLAMPERADQIRWPRVATSGGIILAVLVLAWRPRLVLYLAPYAIVVGVIGYFLRPRPRGGGPRRAGARR